jgi:hypothetical protein
MKLPAEPGTPSAPQPGGTRLPAIVRYWWLTAVRGLVGLTVWEGLRPALGRVLLLSSEVDPDVLVPVAAAWGWPAAFCCWPRGDLFLTSR